MQSEKMIMISDFPNHIVKIFLSKLYKILFSVLWKSRKKYF